MRIQFLVLSVCVICCLDISSSQAPSDASGNAGGSGEGIPDCPAVTKVDDIIRTMADIVECTSDLNCLTTQQCCDTTDGIAVCIPVSTFNATTSTSPTTTTTAAPASSTSSSSTSSTSSTSTVKPVKDEDDIDSGGRSERGPDEVLQPDLSQNGTNQVYKVGNDLVNRRYLLPHDWKSITFVDRKLTLNKGKIMSFLFYFEDTREFLDGMFPGMRLQVWTPNFTKDWAAPIEYTLKCEKIVEKDDVTNTVVNSGLPVLLDDENEIGKEGLLVSLDVSDEPCMHVTADDHIGFCSQDKVLPVPYDFGTDGQMDWMFNEDNIFPVVNETVKFQTLEAMPIPATFSVSIDIVYDENC